MDRVEGASKIKAGCSIKFFAIEVEHNYI